jgi:Patatin-like phospholipase
MQRVRQRFSRVAPVPPLRERPEPVPGRVGICLSGGGIRSASYNLGVLQVLQEKKVLQHATFVSAVSGGAYIASAHAIASTEAERSLRAGTSRPPANDAFDGATAEESFEKYPVFGRGSPEEEYLRNNSSYVAPGPFDKLRAGSIWFRGFLLNLVIVGFLLLVGGTLLGWFFGLIHPCLRSIPTPRCPSIGDLGTVTDHRWILWAGVVPWLAGFGLFAMDALFDLSGRRDPRNREWTGRLMTLGMVLLAVFAVPYLLVLLRHVIDDPGGLLEAAGFDVPKTEIADGPAIGGEWLWLAQLAVGINVLAAGIRFLMANKRSIYVLIVAAVAGPVLIVIPFLLVVNNAAASGPNVDVPFVHLSATGELWLAAGLAAALFIVLETQFSCNRTTLHPFYAWRLSTVFAIRRKSDTNAERIPDDDPVKLTESQPATGPTFLYCAAANTLAEGKAPPGRNAVPFIFERAECGGKLTKRVPTSDLERAMRMLTTPGAVAISGAAFSPTMGKFTKRLYTFLMTLVNARLGVWVPNPRFLVEPAPDRDAFDRVWRSRLAFSFNHLPWTPRPGLRYLIYEFLGWHRLDRRYAYVTDGGHYDNLGLVELLRRGCTIIYCFDASGDKVDTFNTLGEAVSMARTDLLVDIEIEPEALRPKGKDELSPAEFVIGTVRYPENKEGKVIAGDLVFVKAAVTKAAPWDVRAFRLKDKDFPNHSTIDQLFTDQKFESYRRLGEQAAREALNGYREYLER